MKFSWTYLLACLDMLSLTLLKWKLKTEWFLKTLRCLKILENLFDEIEFKMNKCLKCNNEGLYEG